MTDTNKYKSVAVKHSTDNQLKDLSAVNETPISKSAMVSHLVDKEWRRRFNKKPVIFPYKKIVDLIFNNNFRPNKVKGVLQEVKSNDN